MLRSLTWGRYITEETNHYALLQHVIDHHQPTGTAVEFGVGGGDSTRIIANHMPVTGFDSFQGLPEDWRPDFPKGMFKTRPPTISNTHLVIGLFADTLPAFDFAAVEPIGLAHFDCDLYSSTCTALEHVGPHLRPGCLVVFDEFMGYDGAEQHEQRAWCEYALDNNIMWTVIGHSAESLAIKLT